MIMRQLYFTVTRRIINHSQEIIHKEAFLTMYEDKIETENVIFYMKEIYDLSYRKLTSDLGFLYIHTSKGMFPFKVFEEPSEFIRLYKLKKNEQESL